MGRLAVALRGYRGSQRRPHGRHRAGRYAWRSLSGATEDRNITTADEGDEGTIWRSPSGATEEPHDLLLDEHVKRAWRSPFGATEDRNFSCSGLERVRGPLVVASGAAEDRNYRVRLQVMGTTLWRSAPPGG